MGIKLALLSIVMSGCATSPISVYPDFNQHKHNLGTIAIVVDAVVTHDIDGDIDEVVLDESKQLSSEVLQETKDTLIQGGYHVSDVIVSSLGHGINRRSNSEDSGFNFLVKQNEEHQTSTNSLAPPFYISREFDSSENKQALAEIFTKIRTIEKIAENPNQTHKLPGTLIQNINADKVMFIGSYSRRVDMSKQLGQAMLTALLTLGTVAIHEVSYTDGALAILDTKTGEIIWSDRSYFKGGTGTASDVKNHISRMIKNIPAANI